MVASPVVHRCWDLCECCDEALRKITQFHLIPNGRLRVYEKIIVDIISVPGGFRCISEGGHVEQQFKRGVNGWKEGCR